MITLYKRPVIPHVSFCHRRPKEFPPKGYDSVEVVGGGCSRPDPVHTVRVDGGAQEIPLGNVVKGESDGGYYWGPNYPEFICYKVPILCRPPYICTG